jgi:hypothetical protein
VVTWTLSNAGPRLLTFSFGQGVAGSVNADRSGRGCSMTLPKNLGMLLLAVWLILFGLLTASFLGIRFTYSTDLLAVLAIAAGVLLLMQK